MRIPGSIGRRGTSSIYFGKEGEDISESLTVKCATRNSRVPPKNGGNNYKAQRDQRCGMHCALKPWKGRESGDSREFRTEKADSDRQLLENAVR